MRIPKTAVRNYPKCQFQKNVNMNKADRSKLLKICFVGAKCSKTSFEVKINYPQYLIDFKCLKI